MRAQRTTHSDYKTIITHTRVGGACNSRAIVATRLQYGRWRQSVNRTVALFSTRYTRRAWMHARPTTRRTPYTPRHQQQVVVLSLSDATGERFSPHVVSRVRVRTYVCVHVLNILLYISILEHENPVPENVKQTILFREFTFSSVRFLD